MGRAGGTVRAGAGGGGRGRAGAGGGGQGRAEEDREKEPRKSGGEDRGRIEKGRGRRNEGETGRNGAGKWVVAGRGRKKIEKDEERTERAAGTGRKKTEMGRSGTEEKQRKTEAGRGGKGQGRDEKGGRHTACRPWVADRRAIRPGRGRSRRDRPARACPTGDPGRAAARGVGAGPAAHRRHAWRASPQPSFP